MKIELYGNKDLVTSAFAEKNGAGLSLYLGTQSRYAQFERNGTTHPDFDFFALSIKNLQCTAIRVYADGVRVSDGDDSMLEDLTLNDDMDYCDVIFIGENEAESKLFTESSAYVQTCKFTIDFQLISNDLMLGAEPMANFKSDIHGMKP